MQYDTRYVQDTWYSSTRCRILGTAVRSRIQDTAVQRPAVTEAASRLETKFEPLIVPPHLTQRFKASSTSAQAHKHTSARRLISSLRCASVSHGPQVRHQALCLNLSVAPLEHRATYYLKTSYGSSFRSLVGWSASRVRTVVWS